MSSTDINTFIKALEAVKQDCVCCVCSGLCKNPVTLSKCFHIICGEHFEGLKTCPKCNTSLEGCQTYLDERLETCIESVKVLDQIFDKFKEPKTKSETNVSSGSKKRGKQKDTTVQASETIQKPVPKEIPKSTRRMKQKIETFSVDDNESLKENKKTNKQAEKLEGKSKIENHNISLTSNASSKFNKAVEKRNTKGETALHVACRLGKVDKVIELLDQGANTNTKDNAGWTPLHEVVQNGRLDLVKLLLQYNTLINVPGQSNETPLHEAVRYNHKHIAEELVKNGADINVRNCKGETPLQLAKEDMKKVLESASDNILQTQTVNVTLMSELHSELDFDNIRVYCASDSKIVLSKLKNLAKFHSNLNIELKWSDKVTHMVVNADNERICQSSLEVLQGIVGCIWILTTGWVMNSTENKIEPFQNYEVQGVGTKTYNGPKNARYNKYKQDPGIFNGCHFYLHNFTAKYEVSKSMVLTKAIMTKLIKDADGVVLRRAPNPESIPENEKLVPYHAKKDGKLVNCAHYIIFKDMYEPMYNMQHLKALPIGWLIECIEKYELCEPWPMA